MTFFSRKTLLLCLTVLWVGLLAPSATALGQVVIFRDTSLSERYRRHAAHLTRLQLQVAVEQDAAILRKTPVRCRGVIRQVLPPQRGQLDPEASQVILNLAEIRGFHPKELPTVSYWVQRQRAISLKLGAKVTLKARLYALEPNGAVAIELEAPPGWLDVALPLQESTAPSSPHKR